MKELIKKYRGIISYLFFGVCSTLINIITYYLAAHILELSTIVSTVIAWIVAVIFAYITNKIWVFECKSWKLEVLIKEATSFFACRILTGLLDVIIMTVFVDVLLFNDMLIKIISNVIVIILNYIASKLIVFKKNLY
ncbi:MAG: GtrA family protein [Clostridia bacterium]|nr:GtrA family protein [Clostridia bacterium]